MAIVWIGREFWYFKMKERFGCDSNVMAVVYGVMDGIDR